MPTSSDGTGAAIRASGLGKRYLIRHNADARAMKYRSLREAITQGVAGMGRRLVGRSNGNSHAVEEFWALEDLNFDLHPGEAVGVIGRNGAGKSTLLKLLSRITEPTTGRIEISGRVASLLEVGTGFHPELTGRENIYLNAAILGMSRSETRRRFDDIVEFAEVARFLDTPVKRYSSGMYVRLAFAVAAHLQSEILIVDEVLAVGDAAFQKKCLGKMDEVASQSGRTVLFVSHNMSTVANLCTRGIVLERGRLACDAPIGEAIAHYTRGINKGFESRKPPTDPQITRVHVDEGALQEGTLKVEIAFSSPTVITPVVGIVVSTAFGQPLFGTNQQTHPDGVELRPMRQGVAQLLIPELRLHSGSYNISVWLTDNTLGVLDQKVDAVTFDYLSPRYIPNLPPLEKIGAVDVDGHWAMTELAEPMESTA